MSQSRFFSPECVAQYGEAFARAVAFVLDRETEFERNGTVHCERDPDDPGGTTKYGIDRSSHPGVDVPDLTESQAVAIYHGREWGWIRGDKLPAALALPMLDTAVNPGVKLAIQWLQHAVGVDPDGDLGPETLATVGKLSSDAARKAALAIQDLRALYYQNRPAFLHGKPFRSRFLKGWVDRVDLTRAAIDAE